MNLFSSSVCLAVLMSCSKTDSRTFLIDYESNCFRKDGECFRFISGGMHYFRVPSYYWKDRLHKASMLGLNAVETYVAWNVHEPEPGVYDFDGDHNLFRFLELAQEENLLVILRPGPYIDAEWEFGGFPWWLAKNESLVMRTSEDQNYLSAVRKWFTHLFARLVPYMYNSGGPVIAFQVENEYGNYYACDHDYMAMLQDLFASVLGHDAVLFTTDGYSDDYLHCGTIPSLYATIDFGIEIEPKKAFMQQRKYQPTGPLVDSEYYTGWLDYWGEPHQTRSAADIASHLDAILMLNASVNFYMLLGGSNFGFKNGADLAPSFKPVPTSYDYDAPLSEAGDPTEKYFAIRNVIGKYSALPPGPVPQPEKKSAYGNFSASAALDLNTLIALVYQNGSKHNSMYPKSMEDIGVGYGYVLYRALVHISGEFKTQRVLSIDNLHDYAVVLLDGVLQGYMNRSQNASLVIGAVGSQLDILVENQGRLCYAAKGSRYLPDRKGILGNVSIDGAIVANWAMYPITESIFRGIFSIMQESALHVASGPYPSPALFVFEVHLQNVTDTFLKVRGFQKGQAMVLSNQFFNLGRYWPVAGPQQTLYVPKNVLNEGINRIGLFELGGVCDMVERTCGIEFVDKPIFR